ncbi:MAG: transposase [Burkholderiales bacterium]
MDKSRGCNWRWNWVYAATSYIKWQKELAAKGNEAFQGSGRKKLEQRSEVKRLKAELKRVTEERDILKKAAAYLVDSTTKCDPFDLAVDGYRCLRITACRSTPGVAPGCKICQERLP